MNAVTPPTPENVAEITPERVAASAAWGVHGWRESLRAALSMTAEGNVLSLTTSSWEHDPEGIEGREHVRHFRAVVVEGETAPIVVPRPSGPYWDICLEGSAFGDDDSLGWQVVPYSSARKWPCMIEDEAFDSLLFRHEGDFPGGGHISFAEARRFGAALIAHADAAEAAQAEQSGGAQ